MSDGVTIQLPETVLIDPDVSIGEDTVIEGCVQLLGKTKIGAGCVVKTGSVVHDSVLADAVTVEAHSVISGSKLEAHVAVGPFARLRKDTLVKSGARIGNFVESKGTVLGEGSKAMHLSYLGDAKIGSKTNIGAGTITCNYDGFQKYPTTIGSKVFIGSDSALVAPVKIGDGAYVAAGSTITDNVPADALAIARQRQVNKPGWAGKKRRELAASDRSPKKKKPRHR
jgi:bifunctional UDP-N-acetylglucosamine pyrophosphorylase/glucosamine-1-phosphate N-acetyltransferase